MNRAQLAPSWLQAHAISVVVLVFLLGLTSGVAGEPPLEGVVDLDGKSIGSLPASAKKPLVLVFMSVECPIANRYAPELRKLVEANKEAHFVLVYPHPDEKAEAIRQHLKEYELPMNAWRDPERSLVKLTRATITPEAAVFVRNEMVYRGRINDRYAAWGKQRPAATKHDLQEVLNAAAAGKKVEQRFTQAVGCYISSVDE